MDPTASAPLWILTALSGAGRRTALDALTRAGVRCTDGLPLALLPELAAASRVGPAVVTVDARSGEEVGGVRPPEGVRVVFLDAADAVLVRRLADSVEPHPCAGAGNGRAAVRVERALLAGLRSLADTVIDTTELTPAELAGRIVGVVRPAGVDPAQPLITVSSFGFKHGPQVEADWIIDVRMLPNPFWDPVLRPRTGLDPEVREHVLGGEDGPELVARVGTLLDWAVARSSARGRSRLHVAAGCTGGRHRSVVVAEALGAFLGARGHAVEVRHRDVDRPDLR